MRDAPGGQPYQYELHTWLGAGYVGAGWLGAAAFCQSRGGALTPLSSTAELSTVAGLVGDGCLIDSKWSDQ